MKNIISVILFALLFGCSSPFAQFYFDKTGGVDIAKSPNVILSSEDPKLFRGSNVEADGQRMMEDGFVLVGYSHFNAGNADEGEALYQAQRVHASVVILYSAYTNTVSGTLPLTLPNTQTTTTSLSGNVYGSGGYANYSGTAYSTTYGTRTTYMPYNVNRYDYLSTYWVKIRDTVFGIYVKEIPDDIKKRLGSNKGMMVYAVIKYSPAYMADILRGDIINAVGDIEIYGEKTLNEATEKYRGKGVNVTLLREGTMIVKTVQMKK